MTVGGLFLILVLVTEVLWAFSFVQGKRRRKVILKDWVNSNVQLVSFLSSGVGLFYLLTGIVAIGQINLLSYYSGLDWSVIAFLKIADKVGPWILLLGLILFLKYFFRFLLYFNVPNFMCIWKYTSEEIKYVEDRKASKKEEMKSKHPKLYNIVYKGKKPKKAPKYPRLSKFLDIIGDPPKEG